MNLIFKEYIKFLEDRGLNKLGVKLEEGYYWYDKSIIKAFNKQGKLINLVRIIIKENTGKDKISTGYKDYKGNDVEYDNLYVDFKLYKNKEGNNLIDIIDKESWHDTVERNRDKIIILEKHSKKLIKTCLEIYKDRIFAIPHSSGKDSSLVTYLVRQIIENPLIIFNNTSCQDADIYKYIKKENNLLITNPKEGIYKWIYNNNFIPTRTSRACCSVFKENALVDNLNKDDKYLYFMGMRNDESNTRAGYADLWKNTRWGNRDWDACLPIRNWTELDVWLYTLMKNIPINDKYKKGYARVGCSVICGFATKSTWILDQYWLPHQYNRFHKILDEDFVKNKKAATLNCSNEEYHNNWNGGVVRPATEVTNDIIKEFSEQQDLEFNIAKKYFEVKKCMYCDKSITKLDTGLSMKFYGRNTNKFVCIKCMAKQFNVTQKELRERAKEFKNDGCTLF